MTEENNEISEGAINTLKKHLMSDTITEKTTYAQFEFFSTLTETQQEKLRATFPTPLDLVFHIRMKLIYAPNEFDAKTQMELDNLGTPELMARLEQIEEDGKR